MTSATRIPDLPTKFTESEDEFLKLFHGLIENSHQNLVDLSAQYETLREAKDRAASAMEASDHPDAVAFRAIAETVAETVENLQSERDDRIKAIRTEYKTKIDDATKSIDAERERVLKLIASDTISDIDPIKLVEEYSRHLEALKSTAKSLKEHSPELFEYAKTLPTKVAQTTGGTNALGAKRGPTPRLASVVVVNPDGTVSEMTPHTLGEAAKHTNSHAGVKSVTRGALATQMLAVVGNQADLISVDPESPTVFYFTVNEKSYQYQVVAVDKSKALSDDDTDE